jgi:signal transduction histidine kinase
MPIVGPVNSAMPRREIMLSKGFRILDWFIPERSRRSKSDLGRARTFVFTHLVGPASGASIVGFLVITDPAPELRIPLMAVGIISFWLLPPMLRATGNLPLMAILSTQTLIAVTLYGVYNYGGVSSPFLAWLLIALANGFFYLSDRPLTVLAIFIVNVGAFIAIWLAAGDLPDRVSMERMTGVGMVSVAGATLYMAWLAIYYGRLLTSESALEREAQRHRRTAEQLAGARDKAERASREKSIFLAKMSHELRTPLNAVIGYGEILQEDADLSGDAQRGEDLSRITAAGKHLLSLVTDILDISRIEADEMKLQVAEFAVARLVEDVAATTAPLVKSNFNKLTTRVDPTVGRMTSDQLRLRQAALNLMSNAAKFTSNGVIELSARRLHIGSTDWIEIEVQDTGIGIARDDLKTIFQDYRQVNSPEARKRKGTGLGLALSQKLCMMMGGSILADSELGHGSRFTIRVPAILSVSADPTTPTQGATPAACVAA